MTSSQRAILVVTTVTQGVAVGLTFGIFPIFLQPLEQAFDAPRTVVSVGLILISIALAVGGVAAGTAFDRGLARRVMLAGSLLMAFSLLLASAATELWMLGLAAVGTGLSVPTIGPLAGGSLVTRYFDEDRGRALGLISMGGPLGSGLFAGLAGWSMLYVGWREVYLGLGLLCLLITVPIIWFFVPSRMAAASGEETPDVSMRDLLRRPTFWWVGGMFAIASGILMGWLTHAAAFLGEVGFSLSAQSSLMAVVFWMGVPGALGIGLLADRFRLSTILVLMLGGQSAIFALFATDVAPVAIAISSIVFGFLFGGLVPIFMLVLGRSLGPDVLGRAMAMSNLLMLPVMAASVLYAAGVYEEVGSYDKAVIALAIGMLMSVGCAIGANRDARAKGTAL